MIRGLENFSHKERLQYLRLFSLERRQLSGNIIATSNYVEGSLPLLQGCAGVTGVLIWGLEGKVNHEVGRCCSSITRKCLPPRFACLLCPPVWACIHPYVPIARAPSIGLFLFPSLVQKKKNQAIHHLSNRPFPDVQNPLPCVVAGCPHLLLVPPTSLVQLATKKNPWASLLPSTTAPEPIYLPPPCLLLLLVWMLASGPPHKVFGVTQKWQKK